MQWFLINFIVLCVVHQNRGCDDWHIVQVAINEWHGDLNVINELSYSNVNLELVFGEYDELHKNDAIKVNDSMNIELLAEYDDYGIPVLYGILINGVNICDKTGGRIKPQPPKIETTPYTTTTQIPRVTYSGGGVKPQPPKIFTTPYTTTTQIPRVTYSIPEECGITIPAVTPFIHHGKHATVSEFPWHAALFDMPYYQYRCGGSLISRDTVVTAAHCVTESQTSHAISPEYIVVVLGKDHLQRTSVAEQRSTVAAIHVHCDFDSSSFHNDIAVVKLNRAAVYSNFVRPVCVWQTSNDRLDSVVNKYGMIPGFGYNEHWYLPDQLASVNMPVVSYESCLSVHRDFYARVISETNFCAGSRNGSSVCNGDSGGGMVFKINSLYYLRGIVSIGPSEGNERSRCNTRYYIVFTDVAKFVDWLRQF